MILSGQVRETLLEIGIEDQLGNVTVIGMIIGRIVRDDQVWLSFADQVDKTQPSFDILKNKFVGISQPA